MFQGQSTGHKQGSSEVNHRLYYCQQSVYASCGGRFNLKFCFYIGFRHVGQDAASKAASVINTGRCV